MEILIERKPGDARLLAEVTAEAQVTLDSSFVVKSWYQHVLGPSGQCDLLAVAILGDLLPYEEPVIVTMRDLADYVQGGLDETRQALCLLEQYGLVEINDAGSCEDGTLYQVQLRREALTAITYEVKLPQPWDLPEMSEDEW